MRKNKYKIIVPTLNKKLWLRLVSDNFYVYPNSPKSLRLKAEAIAVNFRDEVLDELASSPYRASWQYEQNDTVYLWTDVSSYSNFECTVIGACGFYEKTYSDGFKEWMLGWIWLNPVVREKGLLREQWAEFKEKFGEFAVEAPLSNSMRAFLKKNDPNIFIYNGKL